MDTEIVTDPCIDNLVSKNQDKVRCVYIGISVFLFILLILVIKLMSLF